MSTYALVKNWLLGNITDTGFACVAVMIGFSDVFLICGGVIDSN